ncbi:MAG: TIGR04283 family arsenosugar biosynthesis glycosyltransferase [Synechococcales bacterium]|nr:TIGR04283 family arsenosugar biosynthesis glycosyltransferase [Synechococcales bacterium]
MAQISIIIPSLNEASVIARTLGRVRSLQPLPHEVIVVDGNSRDETVAIAQKELDSFPAPVQTHLLQAPQPGRAVQMNQGAAAATGEILCFLHADTLVPEDLGAVITQTLHDPACAGGGFISLMTGTTGVRWWFSLLNFLKTYYTPLIFRPHLFFRGLRLLFGDQVMFCRRQDFWDCGGFDATMPLLEDAELCLRLVRRGRLRLVNRVVESSDRRVAKWGFFKANVIYAYVGYLWGMGVSAARLKRFYEDIR